MSERWDRHSVADQRLRMNESSSCASESSFVRDWSSWCCCGFWCKAESGWTRGKRPEIEERGQCPSVHEVNFTRHNR